MWQYEEGNIPYQVKSEIDELNHRIFQVSNKTGLNLAPLILEKDGFKTTSLRQVIELVDLDGPLSPEVAEAYYKSYSWSDIPYVDLRYYLRDILRDLYECYEKRQEQLPDFQRVWDRVKYHGEGVKIHFGLRSATVSIPLETLIKYQIFIKKNPYEELEFDTKRGLLVLRYAYQCQLRGCNALDDRADFLGWKIAEYYKTQPLRAELVELGAVLRSFEHWEKQAFPTLTAPS